MQAPIEMRTFAIATISLLVFCGGQTASNTTPKTSSAPACGMTFDPTWSAICQSHLDVACCEEEKACAASATCLAVVECIGKQPRPRGRDAIPSCLPKDTQPPDVMDGLKKFGALENCPSSGNVPYPKGHSCEWPTGADGN